MQSMTGFGYAESTFSLGTLVLELSSLNRKYFDLSIQLPKALLRYEVDIRKKISDKVARGSIAARFFLYPGRQESSPQLALLAKQSAYWKELAVEIGCDPKDVTLQFLLQDLKEGIAVDQNELPLIRNNILQLTDEALSSFLSMRVEEGKSIKKDLQGHLKNIEKYREEIAEIAPTQSEGYKKKLQERMKQWSDLDYDERIMREVSFVADKLDIQEEIIRLQSHADQFLTLFQETRPGKKMDFLLQEMMRETNTIGSKSVSPEMTRRVIEIKHEIEQMREQVQNVE